MKVLVALDTSPASKGILEEIAGRPWPAGCSFEIFSIVEPSHVPSTEAGVRQAVRRTDELVQGAIERLHSQGVDSGGGALVDHNPGVAIIDRAKRMHADFVIVGSHGHSAAGRFLLGSVSTAVLRYSPCSVEIVRPKPGQRGSAQPMKLLLATDGSEHSELAVTSVAAQPWPSGTEIRILSIAEVLLSARQALMELPFLRSAIQSARAEGLARSREAVAAASAVLAAMRPTILAVSEDDPRRAILKEAGDWGADLIVLGSHGRRGMDRFQLGSVSETVALHASCSVQIIRKKVS